jgi:SAM-dependent methyltransferase
VSGSDVWHYQGLTHWGPVSAARIERLVDRMRLAPGARALDLGCGGGALLLALVERHRVAAVGVDRSPHALDLARAAFAARAPEAAVEWVRAEAADYQPAAAFDAVCWLGGPYLGGDFAATLSRLAGWLGPGGYLLAGQGFWRSPPPAEYLAATGLAADELFDHPGNLAAGARAGLRLLYTGVSSRDEWDEFEGTILYNAEQYAVDHRDAPDPDGRLEARRRWNHAQQRWGREVMGFGCYLFRR